MEDLSQSLELLRSCSYDQMGSSMQLLQNSLTRLLQLSSNKEARRKAYNLVATKITNLLTTRLCVFLDGVF